MAAMVANPCLLTFVSCHIVHALVKNLQFLNINNFSSLTKITGYICAREDGLVIFCKIVICQLWMVEETKLSAGVIGDGLPVCN